MTYCGAAGAISTNVVHGLVQGQSGVVVLTNNGAALWWVKQRSLSAHLLEAIKQGEGNMTKVKYRLSHIGKMRQLLLKVI